MPPAASAAEPKPPETLGVRSVSWEASRALASEGEWLEAARREVEAAVKDGAAAVVFPDRFPAGLAKFAPKKGDAAAYAARRVEDALLPMLKAAAAPGMLIVLGSYPIPAAGSTIVHRVPVLSGEQWQWFDKIDLTPAELAAKPRGVPASRLVLYRFRGGLAAVVPGYSLQKPELAVSMKKRGVSLILSPSVAEDEADAARVLRCASGRAAELGAAVIVAAPAGSTLFLPAQKGLEAARGDGEGRAGTWTHVLPWKKLLDLRVAPAKPESRPFLEPSPLHQTEI